MLCCSLTHSRSCRRSISRVGKTRAEIWCGCRVSTPSRPPERVPSARFDPLGRPSRLQPPRRNGASGPRRRGWGARSGSRPGRRRRVARLQRDGRRRNGRAGRVGAQVAPGPRRKRQPKFSNPSVRYERAPLKGGAFSLDRSDSCREKRSDRRASRPASVIGQPDRRGLGADTVRVYAGQREKWTRNQRPLGICGARRSAVAMSTAKPVREIRPQLQCQPEHDFAAGCLRNRVHQCHSSMKCAIRQTLSESIRVGLGRTPKRQ
jgi:hypothetical protein